MLIKDSIRDNCIQFLNFLPKVTFVLPNSLLKVCYQWNMNHMTCHHHIKQVRIHFNAKLEYLEKFVPGCLLSEFELKEIGILIWLRMDQEWTWNGAWEHQMENELIVSELNYDLDQLSTASSSRVDPGQWSLVSKYSKVLYSGKIG